MRNKIRYTLGSIAIVAFAGMALSNPSTATPSPTPALSAPAHDHHEQHSNNIVYGPAPDVFPPGAEMAVLQGDPSVAGALFTVRLRMPNGYIIPPHFHPTDENVTVIKGTFKVGLGDHFSKDAFLPPLYRGDFITAPANANHFAQAKGRTEVQVHAIGPFQMTYVNPADDPRNPK
jgi:quercetin dioxygenase-like cupin family protein